MKLTNRLVIPLANAATALDGERQSDGTVKPYKFTGNVRYAIARTIGALRPLVQAFEKARVDLVAEKAGGKAQISQLDPLFVEVTREIDKLLDIEVEVNLHQVKFADLQADTNAIPGTVLADLAPMIAAEG